MNNSLQPHGPQPTRLFGPWNFPGKNTGVGRHFLLQNTYIYGQLVLNKCSKTIRWGKNSLQQIMLGQLNTHVKERNLTLVLLHMQNVTQSEPDLEFKVHNYQTLEENIEAYFHNL